MEPVHYLQFIIILINTKTIKPIKMKQAKLFPAPLIIAFFTSCGKNDLDYIPPAGGEDATVIYAAGDEAAISGEVDQFSWNLPGLELLFTI